MEELLKQLKIKADLISTENNGTITKYSLRIHPGTKVSKIENSATEIALALKAYGKPIIKIIPELGLVNLELITKPITQVDFNELGEYSDLSNFGMLPIILGRTHDGQDLITDLSIMPHLLVAGTTGSGKSVLLHSIASSIIKYNSARLVLIDPKKVELSYYSNVKQLLYPVITNPQDALDILSDLIEEMENRFSLLLKKSVNNLSDLQRKHKIELPYIVAIIDEFSDLIYTAKKEFQSKICLLAQKSRSAGIHLIIATQRPSVDVITGVIKANFPSRISCRVSSAVDSRVVLDRNGAEVLRGKGDALLNSGSYDMLRFQGAYISTENIIRLCEENKRKKSIWSLFGA